MAASSEDKSTLDPPPTDRPVGRTQSDRRRSAMSTELTPVANNTVDLAGTAPELPTAVREVLPAPAPEERYHVRGLTELWARRLVDNAERRGAKPHTARAYSHALALWLRYCLLQRIDPLRARRADVEDWLSRQNIGDATVHQRLAALNSWYDYLLSNDIECTDPARRVTRPKRATNNHGAPEVLYLTEEEAAALLAAARRRAAEATPGRAEVAARHDAILRVLLTTGVRAGVIRSAEIGDLLERDGHRLLRYHTKHNRWGEKALAPYVVAGLHKYLDLRAAREGVDRSSLTGLLFTTTPLTGKPGGNSLSYQDLIDMVRATAAEAGLSSAPRLVSHSLRHSVGTALAKRRPITEVRDFLDHSDTRITEWYIHIVPDHDDSPAYDLSSLLTKAAA